VLHSDIITVILALVARIYFSAGSAVDRCRASDTIDKSRSWGPMGPHDKREDDIQGVALGRAPG